MLTMTHDGQRGLPCFFLVLRVFHLLLPCHQKVLERFDHKRLIQFSRYIVFVWAFTLSYDINSPLYFRTLRSILRYQ